MPDDRFDRTATFAALLVRSREIASAAAGKMHAGVTGLVRATITLVDVHISHTHTGSVLDRGKGLRE